VLNLFFEEDEQTHIFSFLQLLGKECYDIDIALDDMLGSTFVDKVTQYLASTGEEAQGLAVIPRYIELCACLLPLNISFSYLNV